MGNKHNGSPDSDRTHAEGARRNALAQGRREPQVESSSSAYIAQARREYHDTLLNQARRKCEERGITSVQQLFQCAKLQGLGAELAAQGLLDELFVVDGESTTRPLIRNEPPSEPILLLDRRGSPADIEESATTRTRVGSSTDNTGSGHPMEAILNHELSDEDIKFIGKWTRLDEFIKDLEYGESSFEEKYKAGRQRYNDELRELVEEFGMEKILQIEKSAKRKYSANQEMKAGELFVPTPLEKYILKLFDLRGVAEQALENMNREQELRELQNGESEEVDEVPARGTAHTIEIRPPEYDADSPWVLLERSEIEGIISKGDIASIVKVLENGVIEGDYPNGDPAKLPHNLQDGLAVALYRKRRLHRRIMSAVSYALSPAVTCVVALGGAGTGIIALTAAASVAMGYAISRLLKDISSKHEPVERLLRSNRTSSKPARDLLKKLADEERLTSPRTWALLAAAGYCTAMHLTNSFSVMVDGFKKFWTDTLHWQPVPLPEHADKVIWYGAIALVFGIVELSRHIGVRREVRRIEKKLKGIAENGDKGDS